MMNFDTDLLKQILDVFSGMSATRLIVTTLCFTFLFIVYLTSTSWSSYIDNKLNSKQQQSVLFDPNTYKISDQNLSFIQKTINGYIQKDSSSVGMILVYKLVPENETFYQGRVLIASASNNTTALSADKYNLKWLPISAGRALSNTILKDKIYTADLNQVINNYMVDPNVRDEYMTPANVHAIYDDGGKFIIAVPIASNRVEGYISVYFTRVPSNDAELQQFTDIAKQIASDTGYYVAF